MGIISQTWGSHRNWRARHSWVWTAHCSSHGQGELRRATSIKAGLLVQRWEGPPNPRICGELLTSRRHSASAGHLCASVRPPDNGSKGKKAVHSKARPMVISSRAHSRPRHRDLSQVCPPTTPDALNLHGRFRCVSQNPNSEWQSPEPFNPLRPWAHVPI